MTDLAYGPERGIVKFAMLEFIARVPYQAWERVGYLALARYRRRSALAPRGLQRIVAPPAAPGNQQLHPLILQHPPHRRGPPPPLPRRPPGPFPGAPRPHPL